MNLKRAQVFTFFAILFSYQAAYSQSVDCIRYKEKIVSNQLSDISVSDIKKFEICFLGTSDSFLLFKPYCLLSNLSKGGNVDSVLSYQQKALSLKTDNKIDSISAEKFIKSSKSLLKSTEELYRIRPNLGSKNDKYSSLALANRGVAFFCRTLYPDTSIFYIQRAIEIYEKNISNSDTILAHYYNELALAYNSKKMYREALHFQTKCLSMIGKPNQKSNLLLVTYFNLAQYYWNANDFKRAQRWREIMQNYIDVHFESQNFGEYWYSNLSQMYLQCGDVRKSLFNKIRQLNVMSPAKSNTDAIRIIKAKLDYVKLTLMLEKAAYEKVELTLVETNKLLVSLQK